MNTTLKTTLTSVAAAFALSACTMIPQYEQPKVEVAETFQNDTSVSSIRAVDLGWHDYFADPRLQKLIDIALERNTSLRTAVLNSEIYRKQYMIERNNLLPTLAANANGSRQGSLSGGNVSSSSYNVGLGAASYELDLFGRVRSSSEAALQGYFASVANRDAAHLSLIATVAKAYFNERYAEEAMSLAQRVLKTREETYKLSELRYKAGVISAVALRQQEALIESAKADYAHAARSREQARNALATLINRPIPEDLPAGLPLDKQFFVEKLPAGLSSEVLLDRPDIRAAEHALKQANANIGAARAAFFPSIRLTGSVGTGSVELGGLFKSGTGVWAFAPSITLPIFTWGTNKANLDVAKLRQQAQIVAYESAVQSAFQDVANALAAREQLDKAYDALSKQSRASKEALRLVGLRYKHGVSGALDLLDAERISYSAEGAALSAQLTRAENLADLYKALGGGLKRDTQTGK
ncbi:multidrug efflux transporter outer membrane subunit MtrE [Neisseria gonorrhoeae]|uniref:multidrug efflux transporter outer membrane subunit MtrE n=1 Tax=Neisseria gonorrhoeae TaxID=485 RepID=UPI00064C5298|nr:multidrug efflux transporter outer membrane subunit MtrE [Neisseria gonorrhoeae]KLT03243.1 membrane protein [Neisseria gonorrhoeae MU_NG17]